MDGTFGPTPNLMYPGSTERQMLTSTLTTVAADTRGMT